MRILAIRGRNLASLAGDFAIELDREALGSAGLFAITGPTGAGKSTLLDALCLALFDAMPRLADSPAVAVGRHGEAEELRLRSNDVRGILRRGAAEGYAEVDFLGNDRRRYRSRWEVRRARGRAEGRLQAQSLILTDLLSGDLLGRTKTEVLEFIQQRLGLSFEQFRRSALLAQGDFAAFLKARASERSELLERITGTEIYGLLSRAAHQRAGEEKQALSELEARLRDFLPLDRETRADQERRCEECRQLLAQAEEKKVQLQKTLDWHRRLDELCHSEMQAAEAAVAAELGWSEAAARREELVRVEQAQPLRNLVESCALGEKEVLEARSARQTTVIERERLQTACGRQGESLALAEEKQRQRVAERQRQGPLLLQARALDIRLAQATETFAAAEGECAAAVAQTVQEQAVFNRLQARRSDLDKEQERCAAWLQTRAADALLAAQWELWDGELRRFVRNRGEMRASEDALAGFAADSARLQGEIGEISRRLGDVNREAEGLRRQIEALEADAARYPLEELAAERQLLEERRQRLRGWGELAREALALEEDYTRTLAALATVRARALASATIASARGAELALRQSALAEARRALEAAQIARKEEIAELRTRLHAGDPCPVCGALEHPWGEKSTALFDRLLAAQRQRVETLAGEESVLARTVAEAETEHVQAQRQGKEGEAQLREVEAKRQQILSQWRQHRAEEDPTAAPTRATADALAVQLQQIEKRLGEIVAQEGEGRDILRKKESVRREEEKQHRLRDNLQETLASRRQALQETAGKQAVAASALAIATTACDEAIVQLSEPLGAPISWAPSLQRDPQGFHAACRQRAEALRLQSRKQDEIARELQALAPQLAAAETKFRQTQEQGKKLQQKMEACRDGCEGLLKERRQFFAGEAAAAVEERLQMAEADARNGVDAVREELQKLQRLLAAAVQDESNWQSALAHREQQRNDSLARLQEALAVAGWDADELRRLLDRSEEWRMAERRTLATLDAARQKAQVLLGERREQVAKHRALKVPELDAGAAAVQLEQLAVEIGEAQQGWAAAVADLRADDRRREQAGQLETERQQQRQRWEVWEGLRELIGSADGNKFRAFAQSLTLDALLAHANRHLEDLARRYCLERVPDSDLELQVIDRDMGDEVRAVHSLSGGEGFLVSLALALGLASLSSQRTQVESLFIDEGFGALDPDTLDIAIASLDALQSLGRQVGVISHVPALIERIGIQVRIEACGGGRSTVRIIDESPAPAASMATTVGNRTLPAA